MFRFYWPWFALLLPLPFLVRWIFPYSRKKASENTTEIYFPAFARLKKAFPGGVSSQKHPRRQLLLFFLSLAWIFLVLALMQPERVDQFRQETTKGYDLMLAVDISPSMQAVDFSTSSKNMSRLDITREVVKKFVLGRKGDRVGLVLFGEQAYLHTPLTTDTLSVSRMLEDAIAGMAGNATSIGDAIGMSVRSLRTRPEGSRILILLTDGEDNASTIPPLEAAKLAKQYGIRIYTIGIGRNGPVPFPSKFGGYGMSEAPMDEQLLKEIAKITNGQYFLATDQKALESIYNKIDKLEKTESNQTLFLIREPFYRYPLSLSMLFLFLVLLPSLRYRRIISGT